MGTALIALAALLGVLVAAQPARAASGDEFTVVNHLTITLNSTDMGKSTIEGPSVGGTVTFDAANQMFADAGGKGTFVTYENGVTTADFENAAVKDTVDGSSVYFGLGHMLLGDPMGNLFKNGNAITVQGSGKIVFKNLDVSVLADAAGSGTTGTDKYDSGNVSHGLLQSTNAILSVGSGCEVTLGDGVDISTATPSDNGGNQVACKAIFAGNGGVINIGSAPTAAATALATGTEGTGAIVDGAASTTGSGVINVYTGIVTNAETANVKPGPNAITATVGGQKVMGSSPMNLASDKIAIPSGTVTVTAAPADALIYVGNGNTSVENSTSTAISVSAPGDAAPQQIQAGQTGTVTPASAKQNLQVAVANALKDYPETDSGLYTPQSWTAYQTALKAAQDLLASTSSVNGTQYTQALTSLQTAIASLIKVGVGYTALSSAIDDAQRLVGADASLYPEDAWSAYQAALKNAQDVLANPASTSADMNGAREQLQAAVDALVSVVYRLYNPYDQLHLFTTDANEYATLTGQGWNDEGVAWNAPAGAAGNTAVYRLYNHFSHDHYYTTNKAEADGLVALFPNGEGWTYDYGGEPMFYSCPKNANGIYQLFNPYREVDTHIWTASQLEYDTCQKDGWRGEDVKFYAVSLPE